MNIKTAPKVSEPRVGALRLDDFIDMVNLALDRLDRIEHLLRKPPQSQSRILKFSEVPSVYPCLTVREIRSACSDNDGPRKFKPGHVTVHEIEAWIKRREQKQGVRST